VAQCSNTTIYNDWGSLLLGYPPTPLTNPPSLSLALSSSPILVGAEVWKKKTKPQKISNES
jgi:hypothetical protein